jgi:hypothetical protein
MREDALLREGRYGWETAAAAALAIFNDKGARTVAAPANAAK